MDLQRPSFLFPPFLPCDGFPTPREPVKGSDFAPSCFRSRPKTGQSECVTHCVSFFFLSSFGVVILPSVGSVHEVVVVPPPPPVERDPVEKVEDEEEDGEHDEEAEVGAAVVVPPQGDVGRGRGDHAAVVAVVASAAAGAAAKDAAAVVEADPRGNCKINLYVNFSVVGTYVPVNVCLSFRSQRGAGGLHAGVAGEGGGRGRHVVGAGAGGAGCRGGRGRAGGRGRGRPQGVHGYAGGGGGGGGGGAVVVVPLVPPVLAPTPVRAGLPAREQKGD